MQLGPIEYTSELTVEDLSDFITLLRSLQLQDDDTAKSLLTHKPYLCSLATENGISPLHAAVCLPHTCVTPEIFTLLINNPYTDLNAQNSAGYSALHFMAEYNHYKLLAIFLTQHKQKINLNLLTSENVPDVDKQFTSVYLASLKGNKEALHLLIKAGADVNIQTGVLRWSPLHIACLHAHEDCVFQLLEAGANPQATDIDGATAAHDLAIAQEMDADTFERILLMLSDAKVNFRSKSQGFMADEFALYAGNADALQFSDRLKSHRIPSLKEMCLKVVPINPLMDDLQSRFEKTKL